MVYSPALEQASEAVQSAENFEFKLESVVENIQRNWNVAPKKSLRDEVGHTAFVVFMRKLG
ncbi:hypothetical protein SVXNc_0908 [Candidatus Nanohalococcus occultus]|uniref:Uncharacterized protein n=2 Tax=Candidatus Nanohalococcus occultus TaxID=2978047 RepID=A0ABY8CFC9_9ARCH|nr:hypothetical protein SVXNc_0908 [Candidatus Nanohaloarchaeota archaeon SVXNc]